MKLIVLTRNEQPIYEQLFEQIRAQVLSGELQPHYCLPSIRTVSRELGISVIPVKTAYDLLEKDGYIYGRGVADDKGPTVLGLYALKCIKDFGIQPNYTFRLVMGCSEETGRRSNRPCNQRLHRTDRLTAR